MESFMKWQFRIRNCGYLFGLIAIAIVTPAHAGEISIGVSGHFGDPPSSLVPVPRHGLIVDLWSDPGSGSVVIPGDRVRLGFRANADCYVTVLSVNTEGRVRLLYPGPHDDGWTASGRVHHLPSRHDQYDLQFSGPEGIEYVYAVASLSPMVNRYPGWLIDGRRWEPDPWEDEDLWSSGWVVGDPYYRLHGFCRQLVATPEYPDTYASAWVSFSVGRRVHHPRSLCRDCHGVFGPDPYGRPCPAVRVCVDGSWWSGVIDFRVICAPRYPYEICRDWRPRGGHWRGGPPDGRWRWSTADGPKRLREVFENPPKRGRADPGHEWDRRDHGKRNGGREDTRDRDDDRDRGREGDRDDETAVERDRIERGEESRSRDVDRQNNRGETPERGDRSRDRTSKGPSKEPSKERHGEHQTRRR